MISRYACSIILVILLSPGVLPGQVTVYHDSLKFYYKKNDDDKVLLYYDKILSLLPKSTYYLLHKGAFLNEKERYNEAIKTFTIALEINSNLIDGYVRRGVSYIGAEKYDSGIVDFNRAIGKYRYQDSVIFRFRALAYMSTNQFELAKSDYDSAIKFNPRDKDLLNNRAMVKVSLRDLNGALEDLNKAIKEDKNYLNALKNRAILNSQLGKLEDALKDANQCLKLYPEDETLNLIVGEVYFFGKEYKTAIHYFDKIQGKAQTKESYRLRGMSHYYLVQDHEAIDNLSQFLKFDVTQSEAAGAYYVMGICKNNIKSRSGCDDITKAIELGLVDAKRYFKEDCE